VVCFEEFEVDEMVMIMCICRFEGALKGKKVSLFLRNVQLSLFSLIPGFFIAVCLVDGPAIQKNGFFYGYTAWAWAAILLQAFGGILVAVVVKYVLIH
jgi:UDP-sugar transporter A1/2/3